MKHFYSILTIFIVLLFPISGQGQFINSGQAPSSLRWMQIQTPDFQIIYPDFFEKNAQKIANIYQKLYQHANTLQIKPKKISIIIQADGGISNGMVTSVPRKTELYTTPSQTPSDDCLEHLCVHEFRHVVQIDKINQGLTKQLSYLFGELFPVAVLGAYVPMWFMEGDAVCFESSIGQLGRGRSPEFLNEMKAQVVEKGIYPFSKAVLGSNKDFVPNRYTMGYFMTAQSRIQYGTDIWSDILNYCGQHPFKLNAFKKSLTTILESKRDSLWSDSLFCSQFIDPKSIQKRNTKRNAKNTLYWDNFTELKQIWQQETAHISHHFDTLPTHNTTYTHYYYPTPIDNDSFIAYKKGLQESGSFVLLTGQKEKRLFRAGTLNDYKFAYHNHFIVWSEYFPHPRWEHGGRNRLCSYNLTTGEYLRYPGEHNQYAPFKTDTGWGYVEINHKNQASLVLCDLSLQHKTWQLQGEENELFIHPTYANGKIITVVQSPTGLRLEAIEIQTRKRTRLTEDIHYEIDNPIVVDSTIIYRASYNGNNALYQWNRGTITLLLESKYGVRFPYYQAENQELYFSFYTSDGYKPGRTAYTTPPTQTVQYKSYPLADHLKKEENWKSSLIPDTLYPSRTYRKFSHLVNIHSWGPLHIDANQMEVQLGAAIYSQNALNTLSWSAGYIFNSDYKQGGWLFNASYHELWPIFSLHLESGKNKGYNTIEAVHTEKDTLLPLYVYNQRQYSKFYLMMQLPFNLSKRQYSRSFTPYVRYKIEALHNFQIKETYILRKTDNLTIAHPTQHTDFQINLPAQYYQLLEYGFSFNNQTRMTTQEINPRWGQTLFLGYSQVLKQNLQLGNQWWYDCRLYFPGLFTNHSFELYQGYQYMFNKTRHYNNQILYPRGITLPGYEMATLRSSYHFPITRPDFSLGSFLYFKDIEGCLFYDLGHSRHTMGKQHYSSYGIELTTDSHLFQLTFPVHWGIRTGYETQTRSIFTNLIFTIGLSI